MCRGQTGTVLSETNHVQTTQPFVLNPSSKLQLCTTSKNIRTLWLCFSKLILNPELMTTRKRPKRDLSLNRIIVGLLEVFHTIKPCKHKFNHSSHITSATSAKVIPIRYQGQAVQWRSSQIQRAAPDTKKESQPSSPERAKRTPEVIELTTITKYHGLHSMCTAKNSNNAHKLVRHSMHEIKILHVSACRQCGSPPSLPATTWW